MIKALTLTQPWAQLVAIGAKKIETRSWSTNHRGWLAIHAGKSKPAYAKAAAGLSEYMPDAFSGTGFHFYNLPRGVIVAVAQLVACLPIGSKNAQRMFPSMPAGPDWPVIQPILSDAEIDFGNFTPGRFAWYLENVIAVDPAIPCQGTLGLFNVVNAGLDDLAGVHRGELK